MFYRGEITKEFLEKVYFLNPHQKKSISETIDNYFKESDWNQLEDILSFYHQTYSIDEIVDSYLLIVKDTAEETKFFIENGRYRYSSFEETWKMVYGNQDYMKRYMIGLAISGYLWSNHIKIFHWFQSVIEKVHGLRYLEVGPGHGRYFCEAVKTGNFAYYDAIDVSKASVDLTERFAERFLVDNNKSKYRIFLQDAYNYKPESNYDFIVIAEVLEHVERPERMLEILHRITNNEGYLYVTVPINAPAIDHIYLFKCVEEVEMMVKSAGYEIVERCYAPAGDVDLKRAIRRKNSIIVGFLAKRKGDEGR